MKRCETICRQLNAPSAGWSREVLDHCRVCPACRREMLAQLSGNDSEALALPPALEARTLAACRKVKPRCRLSRVVLWSGAAVAAACLCIGSGVFFFRPAPDGTPSAGFKSEPVWSGAGLERALSEIGQELSATQQRLGVEDLEDHV